MSIVDIMKEQFIESKKVQEELYTRKKIEKQEKMERIDCVRIKKSLIYSDKTTFMEEAHWLEDFSPGDFKGVINSLRVPESIRYIHSDYKDYDEENRTKCIDMLPVPFLYIHTYHMYSNNYILAWTEEGLWKALQFNYTRCYSGGCDGESISKMVGISPDDLLDMLYYVKIYKEDRDKILSLLATLAVVR